MLCGFFSLLVITNVPIVLYSKALNAFFFLSYICNSRESQTTLNIFTGGCIWDNNSCKGQKDDHLQSLPQITHVTVHALHQPLMPPSRHKLSQALSPVTSSSEQLAHTADGHSWTHSAILVYFICQNQVPQTRQLTNNTNTLLTALEDGNLQHKVPADLRGKGLFVPQSWHMAEGTSKPLFYTQILTASVRSLPSPIHPKYSLPHSMYSSSWPQTSMDLLR